MGRTTNRVGGAPAFRVLADMIDSYVAILVENHLTPKDLP